MGCGNYLLFIDHASEPFKRSEIMRLVSANEPRPRGVPLHTRKTEHLEPMFKARISHNVLPPHLKNSLSWDTPAAHTLNGAVHSSTEHDTDDASRILVYNRTPTGTSRGQGLKEHMGKRIIGSRLFEHGTSVTVPDSEPSTHHCLTASEISIT